MLNLDQKFFSAVTSLPAILIFVLFLVFLQPVAAVSKDHACSYLEKAVVEQKTGMSVVSVDEHPPNPMGQSVCFFDIASTGGVRFVQIQMMRSGWSGNKFEAPTLYEQNMSFLDNLQEVEGVGEKALWGGSGMKLGAGLHVLYKDAYFTISAATGDKDKNLEIAKIIALEVIESVKK